MSKRIPFYRQLDAMDCGPACLRMICRLYGRRFAPERLRQLCNAGREGVSMLGISAAAEQLHLHTQGVQLNFEQLCQAPLPCIVHWQQNHFVVVYAVSRRVGRLRISVADPATGKVTYSREEFLRHWCPNGTQSGIALLLKPTPAFNEQPNDATDRWSWTAMLGYLKPYKKLIGQLMLGMLLGSLLQLVFPFLTQSIVDYGIGQRQLHFVTLVLVAQLILSATETAVGFIRSWILFFISSRINISIIADFLVKLMKLPIRFFDTRMTGDILQRIGDHDRIETFLTSSTLNVIFSLVNFFIFSIVLALYSLKFFIVFLIASLLYIVWVTLFLKKRKLLDYKRFDEAAKEQSTLYQLISGMQEIKLNNCEQQKRQEWEEIQVRLFKIGFKSLSLSQYQQSGAFFISETKNIIISFLAATSVISGNITLGMMTAIQYIIGQLNAPVNQMIAFIRSAQDAHISMERLNEIHHRRDEVQAAVGTLNELPSNHDLRLQDLSFRYDGGTQPVLAGLNLTIPAGKVTAIVGTSGSGKTTLIKLLLGFYEPTEGDIFVGDSPLRQINMRYWRDHCGTVMQDGYIFSDTIAGNIAVGAEQINQARLLLAADIANVKEMTERLPLGFRTLIGQEGKGLSQGQKQRILIARAVYKNPDFLFFDEATNALDAHNERAIMEHLQQFFKGRTVVVAAHRLSTVRNADQIVVLHHGHIAETGTHEQLIEQRGEYYELVKNQLELGGS